MDGRSHGEGRFARGERTRKRYVEGAEGEREKEGHSLLSSPRSINTHYQQPPDQPPSASLPHGATLDHCVVLARQRHPISSARLPPRYTRMHIQVHTHTHAHTSDRHTPSGQYRSLLCGRNRRRRRLFTLIGRDRLRRGGNCRAICEHVFGNHPRIARLPTMMDGALSFAATGEPGARTPVRSTPAKRIVHSHRR